MNAFVLFGELKANTGSFERSLISAERRIQETEKDLTRLEAKTKSYGATSATTGRTIEKFNDSIKAHRQRFMDAVHAYDAGAISHRKMASEITRFDRAMTSVNSRMKDQTARLRDMRTGFAGLGTVIASVGAIVGYFGYNATKDFQTVKNQLTAATGSADGAVKKLGELKELSLKNIGVDVQFAAMAFSQLKANTALADDAINKTIKSLGLLKTANPAIDLQQYMRNLTQLFSQGWEGQDFKEAIGNNPRFLAQLKAAFGTDNPELLRTMKESGKLTMESWFEGMADATLGDEKINKLTEQPISKIEKAWANARIDLGQLGDRLITDFQAEIDKATRAMGQGNLGGMLEAAGEALGRKFVEGLSKGFEGGGLIDGLMNVTTGFGRGLINSITKGINAGAFEPAFAAIRGFVSKVGAILAGASAPWTLAMTNAGRNLVQGLINGIQSMWGAAVAKVKSFAADVAAEAKRELGIQSPSKVFFAIGKDVAEGFILGLESMRTGIYSALADLLDVSKLKLTAKDKGGVGLLTGLMKELDGLTVRTREEAVKLTREYQNAGKALQEAILVAARALDRRAALFAEIKKLTSNIDPLSTDGSGGMSGRDTGEGLMPWESAGQGLAYEDPDELLKRLNAEWALLLQQMGTPPPIEPWANFWDQMMSRMRAWKDALPSMKEALGENLLSGLQTFASAFASVLTTAHKSWGDFWKSMGQAALQTLQQIAQELIRIMILKAIANIAGAAAGSAGSIGGTSGMTGPGMTGIAGVRAAGGPVTGGRPYLVGERGPELFVPGASGQIVNNTSTRNMMGGNITININGPVNNPKETASMIARELTRRARHEEMRNK